MAQVYGKQSGGAGNIAHAAFLYYRISDYRLSTEDYQKFIKEIEELFHA